ncbi:MAG TPA: MFS transporter [Steroidobacteraceae bacterium]|jgi:DHA2 family multidrug resistance protein|nr:MFS transporter [Steroidobacteraceae bacterium]
MSAALPASGISSPRLATPPSRIPWIGMLGVLMGTFISTLNGRLSSFGLADIRGAVGAGFDEGAWITTAQTAAQMFVTLPAVWLGAAYGARKVLIWASLAFAVISLLTPLATGLPMLLTLQFLGGLATGFFIPLTLSFIVVNTPPKLLAFGIAIYSLNLELSLNIAASLEGWYIEHLSWHWIFWQNVPLALLMSICLRFGIVQKPITTRPPGDVFALVTGGSGLALIYAALDQGNRLDWLSSGLIWGLLGAGTLLTAAALLYELRSRNPLLNLHIILARPLPGIMALIAFLRLTILATSFLIPLYLGSVRGFRALEVGDTLIWIAAPQLVVCPLTALMLRRTDPRIVASMGFIFISVACLLVAYELTPLWGSTQFLPSQLMQAVGQTFALSGIVFFGLLHLRPEVALTLGAAIQAARLMGGQIGTAFISTLARIRTQTASNLIGQHVQAGDPDVVRRIGAYGAATTRAFDPVGSVGRGELVLGSVVRSAATTQAVIDCFLVVGIMTAIALILLVTREEAPAHPAAAPRLFARREPPA